MRIVFVSNYINHHQLPFCKAMLEQHTGEFVFIQTEPMEEERVQMGWAVNVKEYPFVRCYYEEEEVCQNLIDESEIVIFGGVEDERYIARRLKEGKILIRYSERIYKEGQWKFISPKGLVKKFHDHVRYRNKQVYLLCSGAYVASDFSLIHAYPGKMYSWGYFPEFVEYRLDELAERKKAGGVNKLLWAGRMIDWKHPEYAVMLAEELHQKGYEFRLTMAGSGVMEAELKERVKSSGIEEYVDFAGYKKPEEIRELMLDADIFLFTSDYKEGWGAVLNEAMNSGCAVVAGSGIGAVPYLLQHGRNGMVYRNGEPEEMIRLTEELMAEPSRCVTMGLGAYETIRSKWNAENAAKNLLRFIRSVVAENPEGAADGPMSKAPIIWPSKGYEYTRKGGM